MASFQLLIGLGIAVVVMLSIFIPIMLRKGGARAQGLTMDPGQFFFMDEGPRKTQMVQNIAQSLAPIIGGNVKLRDGGDEVHVTGEFHGKMARIIIRVTFGSLVMELKASGNLPYIDIKYDDEAAQAAAESLTRDAWDDHDDDEQKYFISPHAPNVYMEGDKDEIREFRTRWQQLPPDQSNALVMALQNDAKPGTFFMTPGDTIQLSMSSQVTLSQQAPQMVQQYFGLLHGLLSSMETNWLGHQAHAAMPMAQPAMQAPTTFPPGCQVQVQFQDGNRYPGTVVQFANGQYLCSFSTGQQWVSAQQVSAG